MASEKISGKLIKLHVYLGFEPFLLSNSEFEIRKFFESLLLFLILSLLIHNTLAKKRLSEFHRKNIGHQKSSEKISSEIFFDHLDRFLYFQKVN